MPSSRVHLKVGYNLSKKLNLNTYNYYLGLIAPDAPNLNGFAEKKERWKAHIRSTDLNVWRTNIKDFYNKEKNNYPRDFLLGYYLHILTDIIYDDYFYIQVKGEILKAGVKEEEVHNLMSNDLYNYSFPELKEIKEILTKEVTSYKINNISKELMTAWKNKIIKEECPKEQPIYTTENLIEALTNKVYEEAIKLINSDI